MMYSGGREAPETPPWLPPSWKILKIWCLKIIGNDIFEVSYSVYLFHCVIPHSAEILELWNSEYFMMGCFRG